MTEIRDDCCDCAVPSYPCRGEMCSLRHAIHILCDKCGTEDKKIYFFDGEELCIDCIEERLEVVE